MRVVFFGKSKKRTGNTLHIQRGMEELGHEVLRVNLRRYERLTGKKLAWWHIRRKIDAFKPEVALVYSFDLSPEKLQELRDAGIKTATYFDDCPEGEFAPKIHKACAASDVFFVSNRGQLDRYRDECGANPAYVTGACDPTDHFRVPFNPKFASDVAYIGKADTIGDRIPVMKALSKAFDVKVYGAYWRDFGLEPARDVVYPEQYREICNSAKIVIGADLRQDVDLYFSNRTWLSLGCGAFLCTRYIPNVEEILTEGEHCVFYRSVEDAVDVVGRYLPLEEERQRIAAKGHEYAHAEYSYARMLERVLSHPTFHRGQDNG